MSNFIIQTIMFDIFLILFSYKMTWYFIKWEKLLSFLWGICVILIIYIIIFN